MFAARAAARERLSRGSVAPRPLARSWPHLQQVESTTFLLLRHAHTEANEHGATPRMAGWCDIPLSATGEAQLAAVDPETFDGAASVVYTSTSPRARRTAEAAAAGRRVIPLRSLREIGCGTVEGWLVIDVARRFPELWQRHLAQDDPDFRWPGGESYGHFRQRVLRAVRAIGRRHPGQRVVVVTHAGAIGQIVGSIRGTTPAAWEPYRPPNCSVTTIECDPDGTMRLLEFGRRLTAAVPAAAHPHAG